MTLKPSGFCSAGVKIIPYFDISTDRETEWPLPGIQTVDRLQFKRYAAKKIEIILLGHNTLGIGLGILDPVPDHRQIEVQVAGQFEFQGGRGVVLIGPGFFVDHIKIVFHYKIYRFGDIGIELG